MNKLHIDKTQDYLAVYLLKKEIYSSDLRQVLKKHYDCQIRTTKNYSSFTIQVIQVLKTYSSWICHMPRIWTVLLEKVDKSLTEFELNINWL